MLKNVFLLVLLTWVSMSYAKDSTHEVAHESLADAEAYRVEKPAKEQEAKRSLAGSKIKKKKEVAGDGPAKTGPMESDSEVRYWQYSE